MTAFSVQHMGDLHSYEQALVVLIAFGPFVALAVVVWVLRKRDLAAEVEEEAQIGQVDGPVDQP